MKTIHILAIVTGVFVLVGALISLAIALPHNSSSNDRSNPPDPNPPGQKPSDPNPPDPKPPTPKPPGPKPPDPIPPQGSCLKLRDEIPSDKSAFPSIPCCSGLSPSSESNWCANTFDCNIEDKCNQYTTGAECAANSDKCTLASFYGLQDNDGYICVDKKYIAGMGFPYFDPNIEYGPAQLCSEKLEKSLFSCPSYPGQWRTRSKNKGIQGCQ
jgi:hypothetical protein